MGQPLNRLPRVVLLAQNREEAVTQRMVAAELTQHRWAAPEFVSLDPFFGQDAAPVLEAEGVPVNVVAPRRSLRESFYSLRPIEKLRTILENQRGLAARCQGADALICCSDGALERVLINTMRRRGRPTYLITNGMLFHVPVSRGRELVRKGISAMGGSHLFFSEIGQGGCSLVFAMGQHSRGELVKRGIPEERIVVSGAPRMAAIVERMRSAPPRFLENLEGSRPLKLLFLMGAWDWHGLSAQGSLEYANLRALNDLAPSFKGRLRFEARLHPRSSQREAGRVRALDHVRVTPASVPFHDHLRSAGVVLSQGSTGAFEALALGRMAMHLDLFGVQPVWIERAFRNAGLWCVRTRPELSAALAALARDRTVLAVHAERAVSAFWFFISERSPEAAFLIASRVRDDVEAPRTPHRSPAP